MNERLLLHYQLEELAGNGNVYFQPPENVKLSYPCIVYNIDGIVNYHANNEKYRRIMDYHVVLITKDPEDALIHRILDDLDYSSFENHFVVDNLHHYVFSIKRNHFDNSM